MCRAKTHILLGWYIFGPIFPRGNFIQCARVENAYTHDSTIPNQAYRDENEKRCLCQYSIFIASLLKEGEIVSTGVMCPYDNQRHQVLWRAEPQSCISPLLPGDGGEPWWTGLGLGEGQFPQRGKKKEEYYYQNTEDEKNYWINIIYRYFQPL